MKTKKRIGEAQEKRDQVGAEGRKGFAEGGDWPEKQERFFSGWENKHYQQILNRWGKASNGEEQQKGENRTIKKGKD